MQITARYPDQTTSRTLKRIYLGPGSEHHRIENLKHLVLHGFICLIPECEPSEGISVLEPGIGVFHNKYPLT